MSEIKVITSIQRRRRWTAEAKRALVEEAEQPGQSISFVARKYEINPSLLFRWRRLMREGALEAVRKDERVVPISEVKALKNKVRELERVLGRKTMEAEILKDALEIAREKNSCCASPYPKRTLPHQKNSRDPGCIEGSSV